jgi:uncharacterized protein YjbI with pentapeptide repeats
VADDGTKPRRKAKDNPWYRLATLHGEPSRASDEIAGKNRATWNRWMASRLSDDVRASLLEELTPFPDDELRSIEATIGSSLSADLIDFSDTDFEAVVFAGFVIPEITFAGATFSGNAIFANATFSDLADFRAEFSSSADFSGATFNVAHFFSATFIGIADFRRAAFIDQTDFTAAVFSRYANFTGATFKDSATFIVSTLCEAQFTSAIFSRYADFTGATFSGKAAYFTGATFSAGAHFDSATFSADAYFSGEATFSGYAYFGSAAFNADAYFTSVTFGDGANFAKATFSGDAGFVNAEMKGVTHFEYAKFGRPPQFFGAKLHEGTAWRYVSWPAPPEDKEQAGTFVEAYERLKLEMDRLKKHGDELDFFARELQCLRVLLGPWKGLPFAIYGFLSDYGRSFSRPLYLLAVAVFAGTFLFAAHLVGFWTPLISDPVHMGQAIGLSFANTFGVLGIRRDFTNPQVLQQLPSWLMVISTIQSILGIVLLFLFGLGIRNRFRMK